MRLNYEVSGQGEPLILLHGNGEDLTYFKNQVPVFSLRYTVYAVDTRGHGKSPRGTGKFRIERFAEDLYRFMRERHLKKAHILGFSDGANIAMYFAIRHPEMVDKLILNGGNAFPTGLKAYFNIPCQVGYRVLKPIAKKVRRVRFAELLGLMALEPHITPAQLAEITAPTLVLAGTRDIVKRSHTLLIADSIPGAQAVFIEGGHMISSTVPKVYNEVVMEFLKNR